MVVTAIVDGKLYEYHIEASLSLALRMLGSYEWMLYNRYPDAREELETLKHMERW